MKKTFTIEDIKDQEKLFADINETVERIVKRKANLRGRTKEQVLEDTKLGLVLEHYLMQEKKGFVKLREVEPEDIYHDLLDKKTKLVHECKVIKNFKGWDDYGLAMRIAKILRGSWNRSTYVQVASYDPKTKIYTYQGFKKIR